MAKQISLAADVVAHYVESLDVGCVFGVGGANIEDLFAAVQRRRPSLHVLMCKHEHAAGCAADAYARCTGGIGIVMVTSGGGAMNLVPAIAESFASRIPVLALIGEAPSSLQGCGAFQDMSGQGGALDALDVYRGLTRYCARVRSPAALPEHLVQATQAARGERPGPAVLLLAKDHQQAPLNGTPTPPERQTQPIPTTELKSLASALRSKRVVLVLGPEVMLAGAKQAVASLAERLQARVVCTPDARDAFDNHDPRFIGVLGTMAQPPVVTTAEEAEGWLVVGTRLPLLARQGFEVLMAQRPVWGINPEPCHLTNATFITVPRGQLATAIGYVAGELSRLAMGTTAESPWTATRATAPNAQGNAGWDGDGPLRSAPLLQVLQESLPPAGVVLVDAGNTGAHAVHYLRAPTAARWLIAMGMAGLGYTFGAALGAASATGQRCTVLAGDGAFYMHGWEIHTAVQYSLPITYVLFNNRAHGMCLVREHLLLGKTSGYNSFAPAHLGAGLAAALPGLVAQDCVSLGQFRSALRWAATQPGPVVLSVELDVIEVPPFRAFMQAAAQGPFQPEAKEA